MKKYRIYSSIDPVFWIDFSEKDHYIVTGDNFLSVYYIPDDNVPAAEFNNWVLWQTVEE